MFICITVQQSYVASHAILQGKQYINPDWVRGTLFNRGHLVCWYIPSRTLYDPLVLFSIKHLNPSCHGHWEGPVLTLDLWTIPEHSFLCHSATLLGNTLWISRWYSQKYNCFFHSGSAGCTFMMDTVPHNFCLHPYCCIFTSEMYACLVLITL
jgi:hypothetical protein